MVFSHSFEKKAQLTALMEANMSGKLNPSAEVGRGSARQLPRLYRGGKGVLQGEMTGLRVVGGRAVCTGVPAVTERVCDCHCAL